VPINKEKDKAALKDKLIKQLRSDDPSARENLAEAVREKKITVHDRDQIRKEAKTDPLVVKAEHMKLEVLAERYEQNATPEQKNLLKPILRKKIMNKAGQLSTDEKQKYLKILNE
jgi:hypothetical protein